MTLSEKITDHLFDLWEFIGECTHTLLKTEEYYAVMPPDSDWPKRIFRLSDRYSSQTLLAVLIQKMREKTLPHLLTLPEESPVLPCLELQKVSVYNRQVCMSLDLHELMPILTESGQMRFVQVETPEQARMFAGLASESFGYTVDPLLISSLIGHSGKIRFFLGYYRDSAAACGLLYYDRQDIPGLHLIGTIPRYRGLGLGRAMTLRLIEECTRDQKELCVLQASASGETLYRQLGFTSHGVLFTFRSDSP